MLDYLPATTMTRGARMRWWAKQGGLPLAMRPHLFRFLLLAQNGRCAGCGEPFTHHHSKGWKGRRPSLDHVMPLSLGGYDGVGNIVVMHIDCNVTKNQRKPTGCELIWLIANCDRYATPVRLLKSVAPWLLPAPKSLRHEIEPDEIDSL